MTDLIECSVEDVIKASVQKGTVLTEDFCSYTLFCLCMAVSDMHSSFAIHRNISPSNLYVDPEKALLSNMKDAIFLVNDKKIEQRVLAPSSIRHRRSSSKKNITTRPISGVLEPLV